MAGVAAGCLLAGVTIAYLLRPAGHNIANYRYTPFASDATNAVWSPDGKAIAYSGKVNGIWQVFLRYLNSPAPVQLTHGTHTTWPLGWSSDRSQLIIAESLDKENTTHDKLFSVATVGGDPEYIMDLECIACDLSRDGRVLATLLKRSDGSYGVAISDPVGSPLKDYKPDPFASKEFYNDPGVAFSPDGKSILLVRTGDKFLYEMWRLPYPAGNRPPERIRHNLEIINQNATGSWMPDNRHIVVSFSTNYPKRHLAIVDTEAEGFVQLTGGTSDEVEPISSPDGKSIIYTQHTRRGEVISVSLDDGSTKALVSTSSMEREPSWAAKVSKLVWATDRSGHDEIWVRLPDGSESPVVRQTEGPAGSEAIWTPSLSPNGDRVVYCLGSVKGLWLWLASLSGGSPIRLTNGGKEFEAGGSWSPDGSRIAYIQIHNDKLSLMAVKTTGNATPVMLKDNVASYPPDWSPAGDWITYRDAKGWNLVSPDGKSTKFLTGIETPYLVFSKDGKTLYGIQTAASEAETGRATLFSLDLATLNRKVIRELGKDFVPAGAYHQIQFSLAPDGKSFVYSTIEEQHDLWMLTGYRQPGFWNQVTAALHLGASK